MKQTVWIILTTLVLCTYSCKEVSVDFSYEPTTPTAGDTITFTNTTSGGEDYSWNFGDNSFASSKHPTHIYKQAGTYMVTLTETKSKKSITHTVTVVDSVPSFAADTDAIHLFVPVTLSASVWNPYSHKVQYQWTLSDNCHLISGPLTNASIKVLFTKVGQEPITLVVTKDGVSTIITRQLDVLNTPAPSLLMEAADGQQYTQRFYDPLWEVRRTLDYEEGRQILAQTQEKVTEMRDSVENKVYFTTEEGLMIQNTNGTNLVCITPDEVKTLVISRIMNKLFYATTAGLVYMMPLIHTDNNRFQTTPMVVDSVSIKKLAVDEELR